MMRRLCVGLAAALAIIAPASARADWAAPLQVSHVGPELETPRLAFDGAGHAFAAWDAGGLRNLYAAKLGARAQLLGDDVVLDDLSASRNGSVLLLATGRNGQGGRIETFTRPRGGRFRPSQVLDRIPRPYAYLHHALLGTDPAGDAAVVWTRARRNHLNNPLLMAVRHGGGRFGRAHAISKSGVNAFSFAMSTNGEFVAAWTRGRRVEARVGHGKTLGPVRRIGSVNTNIPEALTVAIDGAGNALVAWLGTSNVEVDYRPAGGGFQGAQGLPHEAGAAFAQHLGLVFTSTEHALLALGGSNAAGPGIFAFDVFQGQPSPGVRISAPGQGARLQSVAAGPRGQVAVAWATLQEPISYTGPGDLFVSYRDTGAFSPPEQTSAPAAPLADTSGFPVATLRFDPASGSPNALWVANRSPQSALQLNDAVETSTRR